MPRLGAVAPTLPGDAAYRALGRTEAGAAAQLLLLWIGGEVGHRAILMQAGREHDERGRRQYPVRRGGLLGSRWVDHPGGRRR